MKIINERDFGKRVSDWVIGKKIPKEINLSITDNKYLVMDNTTDDCWVEEFNSLTEAVLYGYGYSDSEGYINI